VTGDDRVPQPEYYQLMEAREESQRIVVEIKAENHLDAICFPRVRINAPTTDDVLAASWTCLEFPTNTVIASQLWMPAITIPAGFTDNGLPVGLELMALPYQERNCSVRRTASSRPPTPGRPPA
jgi:amidase